MRDGRLIPEPATIDSAVRVGLVNVLSHAGASPGPASGIRYTVRVVFCDGKGVQYTGVRPALQLWSDDINTVAIPPGPAGVGMLVGSYLLWFAAESPETAPCEDTP